ncbi:opioid growth factor receptor-related protein [Kaistia terrae]|uniref:Opioid growth factor receptor-related protein n=1 Tax=Kaistia terrae TaxID=537017 RepID=A0ABW0PTQ8_9HYPH|nr:opioid growth factor receptor-related protein [Kaistia terrae]MCX5577002.1 opioid growth factor receptor-related protein [Kaistia terrae]
MTNTESALVRFHAGVASDSQGRQIAEILGWDDDRLEFVHDYIQWLFPLPERSAFNPDAPILTTADIAAFRQRPDLQASLDAAFRRMLAFYGFEEVQAEGGLEIVRSAAFPQKASNWLRPGNHNLLRISRILRALTQLGLAHRARAFLVALETLYEEQGERIGPVTLSYWRQAVR